MSSNAQDSGHLKVRPNYPHLSVSIGIAAIVLLIYSSMKGMLNEPALISIAVFNLLFVFLLFPLEGPLFRKVYLLIAGNTVGLVWHFIKLSLGTVSIFYLGAARAARHQK